MQEVAAHRQKDIVVVLEDLYDPHNAEAIFRTCDGFGVQNAYLIFDTQPPFNPRKVGKATSSSANKWLDFKIFSKSSSKSKIQSSKEIENDEYESSPTERCIQELKKEGYTIVGSILDKNATNLYEFTWPDKIAFWLGNEHSGLSEQAKKACDHTVYIPMQGMVESLNVSVAAGVFLSEIYRNRNKNGNKFTLSEEEQKKLVDEFVGR